MNVSRPFVLDPQAKSQKQKELIDTENKLINKFNEDSEEEAASRTILDDSINDIFDGNGILVKNYRSIDAWQTAIESLDDAKTYNCAVKKAALLSNKYSLDEEVERFVHALHDCKK